MLNSKHMIAPAAAPLAGVLLAVLLTAPVPAPQEFERESHDVVHAESRALLDADAGTADVEDYPDPPPLEWTLGPQRPHELAVADDSQTEANGLSWQILREGDASRATPTATAVARMRFVGWTASDGEPLPGARALTMIPMDVPLDEMVPGFSQAAQQMHPGERRRVWVPQNLAFDGRAGRPEGAIVYDMELVSWRESGPLMWSPECEPSRH